MSRITSGWRGAKRILAAMPGSSGRRQHFELCALSGRGQTPVVGHDGLKVFADRQCRGQVDGVERRPDRKSTRLNSSHANISYAVFCLKKKIIKYNTITEIFTKK